MNTSATRTYLVGVIERSLSYFKVEAANAVEAAENWQDGEFWDCDDESLESEGLCNVREEQANGRLVMLPRSQWEAAIPETEDDRLRRAGPDLLELARQVVLAKDSEEGVPVDLYHAAVRIIARIEDEQA